MWVRALVGTHYTAPVLRSMELWEIGVVFGADVGNPAPRIVIPLVEDPDAPPPTGPRLREVD